MVAFSCKLDTTTEDPPSTENKFASIISLPCYTNISMEPLTKTRGERVCVCERNREKEREVREKDWYVHQNCSWIEQKLEKQKISWCFER